MSKLHLEKIEYYYSLFSFYRELLTEKQQTYFHNYYFKNLSLQEISDIYKVSRAAVYDNLIKTQKILDNYEKKLLLYEKYQARKKIYDKHSDCEFVIKLQKIDQI